MEAVAGGPTPNNTVSEALEAFARDLLALVRAVRVYPSSHPHLSETAERLTARLRAGLPSPLALDVLEDELALGGVTAGGKHSRVSSLASQLHMRRVLRLIWGREATASDATAFATLLSDPALSGEELTEALRGQAVFAIRVEPLDFGRLHQAFQEGVAEVEARPPGGPRQVWEWLLSQNTTAAEVAEALGTEKPWEGEAPAVARWLLDLGDKFREALALMPDAGRRSAEERLTKLGDAMGPRELGELLLMADARAGLQGPLVAGITRGMPGEKLVEVLAAMVSLVGRDTRRIADVFRRFAPTGGKELLELVEGRLSADSGSGFALEVWKAVESFLLDLDEDPFMEEEYSSSLDSLSEVAAPPIPVPDGEALSAEPSEQLDWVYLTLASDDHTVWGTALLDRLEARADGVGVGALARFHVLVERALPGLVGQRPRLVETVFHRACRGLRSVDPGGREALLEFLQTHERILLDPVLRALGLEERITVRRFLVEALCSFSPAATPALVLRLRSGPWFVTRNLAMALGRRGDPRTIPALRGILSHENPKVRLEAVQALGRFDVPAARNILGDFLRQGTMGAEERALVENTLSSSGLGRTS